MRRIITILTTMLIVAFLLTACDGNGNNINEVNNVDPANTGNLSDNEDTGVLNTDNVDNEGITENNDATDNEMGEDNASGEDLAGSEISQEIDNWLQQLNNEEIEQVNMGEDLDWALGYFLYYSALDSTNSLGIDNMIYHALEARRRLETGEVTEESMSVNDKNLLATTEGLQYDPDTPLTEQVAQTEELRMSIMEHIVDDQQNLSPQEALDSGNIIGVFGPPAAGAVGGKYLVFVQSGPDQPFEFLGVIMAVDATGDTTRESYSQNGWNDLAWLGDASGPFWDDLPVGTSGDPANTGEARPGVLLMSEEVYMEIMAADAG